MALTATAPAFDDATSLLGGRARWLASSGDAPDAALPLSGPGFPFAPQRLFVVDRVPPGTRRGGHAHRSNRQVLVCLDGHVDVELRASGSNARVELARGSPALLIEPGVWAAQTYRDAAAMLLVLASEPYDPDGFLQDDAAA